MLRHQMDGRSVGPPSSSFPIKRAQNLDRTVPSKKSSIFFNFGMAEMEILPLVLKTAGAWSSLVGGDEQLDWRNSQTFME